MHDEKHTQIDGRRVISFRNVGLAGTAMLLPLLAFVGLTIFLVNESNRAERAYSEQLTQVFLNRELEAAGKQAKDYAWWNPVSEHAVREIDPDWVDVNIGAYIHQTFGFNRSIVLSATDRVIVDVRDSVFQSPVMQSVRTALAPLAEKARATSMAEPGPVSAYAMLDGELHMVGAAAITPESPTEAQLTRHARPVLFFARRINDDYLRDLARTLKIGELVSAPNGAGATHARVTLLAADGSTIATLAWVPESPGQMLVEQLLPAFLLMVLATGALAFVIYRRLTRLGREAMAHRDAAIEAAERATLADQAKSIFLSSMSHELRTPLQAIFGYTQILQLDPALSTPQRNMLQGIQSSGSLLLGLVEKVLDFEKISRGEIDFSLRPVSPGDAVGEVVEIISGIAATKSVRVENRVAERDCRPVMADSLRLGQILTNLLSNAVKYNRSDGEVVIDVVERDDGMSCFSVEDDGPGVPGHLVDRLFVPFDRLGQEARSIDGVGLGLAIAHELVTLMGGEMGYERREQGGSRFWFTLLTGETSPQMAEDDDARTAESADRAHGREGAHVLYVEDNPASIEIMSLAFQKLLCEVELTCVTTAEEAIELIRREPPDLILMDIGLPGTDGNEATRRLKSLPGAGQVPVIAVTAATSAEDKRAAASVGYAAFLEKPINVQQTVRVIAEHLSADEVR